ncbi:MULTISPECIES: hypothetical protein [unclassified Microbacterium]|uniref:hypothetical protein n=1 Tax=unclassified Microbacterium TaxID=2609290 RepID=UPI0011B0363E|nr:MULTISPECIES: hypothetical protein [unclassified Microbacterium]
MQLLLAEDGMTFGYGYGPGWSMIFGHPRGEITVEVGQWVVRHDDGRIEVLDDKPNEAEIFDAAAALAAACARQLEEETEPSETERSSPRPVLLHIKGESGVLCGVRNPSHVTDGVRYADCSACLAAVTEQVEGPNR